MPDYCFLGHMSSGRATLSVTSRHKKSVPHSSERTLWELRQTQLSLIKRSSFPKQAGLPSGQVILKHLIPIF